MNLLTGARRYPGSSLVLLAFIAFIALGLPDGLLGVGWPSIRAGFGVPLDGIGLFLAAATIGYMTSSFLSGWLLAHAGIGRVLASSCGLTGLAGALLGSGLLIWNPSEIANVLAVALIGVSIAPIFPAMMSGTRTRVGDRFAANTIGIQMAATGFGTATIPGTMGVLARHISLEVIPVCLLAVYAGLSAVYLLTMKLHRMNLRKHGWPTSCFFS